MATSQLSISRLVNATVNLSPNAAQTQNLNNLLVLGSTQGSVTVSAAYPYEIIDTVERYRTYTSSTGVANDFGSTAPETLAAQSWFSQNPQPTSLLIGKWAKTATPGSLRGATLTSAQQSALLALSGTYNFVLSVSGVNNTNSSAGISLTAKTDMGAFAAAINTALSTASSGKAICIWNANYNRFEITSMGTLGTSSTVAFATLVGSGNDLGALMGLQSGQGGYVVAGLAAETALASITLFDNTYGQSAYGFFIIGATNDDNVAVAQYIESTTTKHVLFVNTQESGVLTSGETSSVAYRLLQLNLLRIFVQYSSTSPYAVLSAAAKALTINYNGNSTVIDLDYKQEPGIIAETLNVTQLNILEAKNCNVFVAYNNNTAILEPGNNVSGVPFDVVTGTDWLALQLQTNLFNALYLSPTKIPQTDAGNTRLVNVMEAVLSQAVTNGLLAPGTWRSDGFGVLKTGDFMPKGYYVYAPLVANQSASSRSARQSVAFQIAANLAGAIRTISLLINVSR